MQASQRNTSRRNDYSSLSTMVTSYVGNNNGQMPKQIDKTWLNANGTDPDGVDYTATKTLSTDATTKIGTTTLDKFSATGANKGKTERNSTQVYLIVKATCQDGQPVAKNGIRNFVIYGYIENGANNPGTYCLASNA